MLIAIMKMPTFDLFCAKQILHYDLLCMLIICTYVITKMTALEDITQLLTGCVFYNSLGHYQNLSHSGKSILYCTYLSHGYDLIVILTSLYHVSCVA